MDGPEQQGEEDIVFQAVQYNNSDFLAELLAENPGLISAKDGNLRTALHLAALQGHTKCADLLLQAGADIDAVSGLPDSLRTPLVMAASTGHSGVLSLLVANGADLFYFDAEGHSALQLAQMGGYQGCANILIGAIEKLHSEAKEKNKKLCSACIDGNLSAVLELLSDLGHKTVRKQVLNGFGQEEKSALFLAAEHGRTEVVKGLLTVSDHSILFEPTGDTLLHAAIASKEPATVEAILHKFPFLMSAANLDKSLPLHWACRCGNAAIVQLLLEADYGQEELKFFEFPHESQQSAGPSGYLFPCDLNAPDQEGRSPLYLAVMEGHVEIVQYLAQFKMPVLNGSNPIGTISSSSMDMESPFVFDTYVNGRTPLMVASSNGADEIVRCLLQSGHVDVNLPIALTEAETTTIQEAHCLDGSGALIEAAKRGHSDVLRLLFRHGAFDYGNRALTQLNRRGMEGLELVGLFLEHLAFPDTEHRVVQHQPRSKRLEENNGQILGGLERISSTFLGTQHVPAGVQQQQQQAVKACQLNWANTELRELKLEWLLAAAARLNPPQAMARPTNRHFPLLAITKLDLSGNLLMTAPAFLFAQLPSLHSLELSKNAIHRLELPPEGADWQCPQLEVLNVDQNQLEEMPAALFSPLHFPRLRQLSAQGNRLRRVPQSVWTAPRLLELNLANNQLAELNTNQLEMKRPSQHGQLSRQGMGGAAGRISRQKGKEQQQRMVAAEEAMASRPTIEPESRQSRATKRESPQKSPQKSGTGSRRNSNEQQPKVGRRQASSATGSEESGRQSSSGEEQNQLVEVDIQRVNVWQKRIQLSNIDDDTNAEASSPLEEEGKAVEMSGTKSSCTSPLQVLNLSGNKFTRMPTCLACCCPRLNRLDLSRNALTSLGPVECLPSALRHLDVSANKLCRCFAELPAHLRQKLRICEVLNMAMGMQNGAAQGSQSMARHSRSRSKSVARSQRSLSVVRNNCAENSGENATNRAIPSDTGCLHKSHCRLEALRTLNLSNNQLKAVDVLLVPLGNEQGRQPVNEAELSMLLATLAMHGEAGERESAFDWKEGGEQLKPYLLFPSLTCLDLSANHLCQLPPVLSLLSSLAVLNVSNNAELERLPPELGLLDKLWNIGLNGCQLREEAQPIRQVVQAGNYKTAEVLSQLRQRLENSIAYPKMKLMFLGGSGVGKTTLLHQMRLEGTVPKRSLQNGHWGREWE